MRKIVVLPLLLSCVACYVQSLQPLYEPGQLVFDRALLGTWNARNCYDEKKWENKDCRITLTEYKKDEKTHGYDVMFIGPDDKKSTYHAFLVQVGPFRFLDTSWPEDGENDDYAFVLHAIPAHMFWKVSVDTKTLTLQPLGDSWFEHHQLDIRHERINHDVVLSAPPRELQKFIKEHAADADFYEKAMVWHKA